jgi:hypothetical protein
MDSVEVVKLLLEAGASVHSSEKKVGLVVPGFDNCRSICSRSIFVSRTKCAGYSKNMVTCLCLGLILAANDISVHLGSPMTSPYKSSLRQSYVGGQSESSNYARFADDDDANFLRTAAQRSQFEQDQRYRSNADQDASHRGRSRRDRADDRAQAAKSERGQQARTARGAAEDPAATDSVLLASTAGPLPGGGLRDAIAQGDVRSHGGSDAIAPRQTQTGREDVAKRRTMAPLPRGGREEVGATRRPATMPRG